MDSDSGEKLEPPGAAPLEERARAIIEGGRLEVTSPWGSVQSFHGDEFLNLKLPEVQRSDNT